MSQFPGVGGWGGGLWSFQSWKHCATLISVDTVFTSLSVSLIGTCSPLGRARLCKVTSWRSMLTGKHSKDVNWLGKLQEDFRGDERDNREGCWQARIWPLLSSPTFTLGCSHYGRFKKRKHKFWAIVLKSLNKKKKISGNGNDEQRDDYFSRLYLYL